MLREEGGLSLFVFGGGEGLCENGDRPCFNWCGGGLWKAGRSVPVCFGTDTSNSGHGSGNGNSNGKGNKGC